MARRGFYKNRNSKRLRYRIGGKFAANPTLEDLMPGQTNVNGEKFICSNCKNDDGSDLVPIMLEWRCSCGQLNYKNEPISKERLEQREAEQLEAERESGRGNIMKSLQEFMTKDEAEVHQP